ncbi:MAG: cyclohexanecarboxylate-CoA ligase [Candidatus Poriferisodalaceae bacterium]
MSDISIDASQAEQFRAAGWWRDRTFLEDFDQTVAAYEDKVAIVSHRHDDPESASVLSYRQLGRYVDRFAGALVDLGVEPGQIVSVQLPNDWQFAALTLACARVGAVVNPLVSILRERELTYILGLTESSVMVVPSTFRGHDYAAMLDRVLANVDGSTKGFAVGLTSPVGRVEPFAAQFMNRRWEDETDLAAMADRSIGPDDLAELQFTSGTTGEPKGVMHTSNTIFAGTRAFADTAGLIDTDSILMPSTLGHQTGFLVGIVLPLTSGMKVVYQDVWDPEVFCQLADDEQVTFSAGATPFLSDITTVCGGRGRPLQSMRSYVCAGAPIPPPLVEATRASGIADLLAVWGMTENGAVTTTRPGDPIEVVADSDGQPVEWMDVRIADDDGNEVPVDEIGRLLTRGASQTIGYFRRAEVYQEQLSDDPGGGDQWFDTGDLARRRADGGIRIAGRTKDLVIRGGENVPVVEVESLLFGHPRVREVAVIGYPDERLGERACAVVVADGDPPTLADLTGVLAAAGMAKQFWPERVELLDEMPKTASGKIQKFQLRQRFA